MKKRLITMVAVISLLIIPMAASAKIEFNVKDKMTVQVYGQVNRAVLFANDGDNSELFHVDTDTSSTRFGFKLKASPFDKGLTVGAHMQWEYESNSSTKVNQIDTNTSGDKLADRILEVFLEGNFGRLTLGQGSTASDGTSEVDLSGTKLAGLSRVAAIGGGLLFYDDAADALSGVKVSSVMNNLDGNSRKDRLRYDTPKFNGFSAAASVVSDDGDDAEDFALRYSGKLGSIKTKAAVSYVNYSGGSYKNQISGSFSCLAKNGFNVTLAGGTKDSDVSGKDDPIFYYAKLGYIANLIKAGTTAFAIDFGRFEDQKTNDDEADTIGFGCVQKLKDWYSEVFFGYRMFSLDRTGTDYSDIHTVFTGLRIKF
jgi:hypothetical protein